MLLFLLSDSLSSSIIWTPNRNGNYIISVEIGYDGNKSVTTIENVAIKDSPESFIHRLAGIGTGLQMPCLTSPGMLT